MFTLEQQENISLFIQYMENYPITDPNQESATVEGKLWTTDMWTLETAIALNMHPFEYLERDIPKDHPRGDDIVKTKLSNLDFMGTKLSIFLALQKIKEEAENVLICEVGRGLDILIAGFVKSWKIIYCYDHFPYECYIDDFFCKKMNWNVKFEFGDSPQFPFDKITEPTIVVAINSWVQEKQTKLIHTNPNIKYFIMDGYITKAYRDDLGWRYHAKKAIETFYNIKYKQVNGYYQPTLEEAVCSQV